MLTFAEKIKWRLKVQSWCLSLGNYSLSLHFPPSPLHSHPSLCFLCSIVSVSRSFNLVGRSHQGKSSISSGQPRSVYSHNIFCFSPKNCLTHCFNLRLAFFFQMVFLQLRNEIHITPKIRSTSMPKSFFAS